MARQFNQQTQQELAKLQPVQAVRVSDTIDSCWYVMQWTQRYLRGEYPPHYPVPAIRDELGIKDDWTQIGVTYVDWSMSRLDWY